MAWRRRSSPAPPLKGNLCMLQVEAAVTFPLTHTHTHRHHNCQRYAEWMFYLYTLANTQPPLGAGCMFQHAKRLLPARLKGFGCWEHHNAALEKDRKRTNKAQHGPTRRSGNVATSKVAPGGRRDRRAKWPIVASRHKRGAAEEAARPGGANATDLWSTRFWLHLIFPGEKQKNKKKPTDAQPRRAATAARSRILKNLLLQKYLP